MAIKRFFSLPQGMYIKSTYDGLHVITGTTEGVSRHFHYCNININTICDMFKGESAAGLPFVSQVIVGSECVFPSVNQKGISLSFSLSVAC